MNVSVIEGGLMLMTAKEGGGMGAKRIDLPETWKASGSDWMSGFPLSVDVVSGEKAQVSIGNGEDSLLIYEGDPESSRSIAALVTSLWERANGIEAHTPVAQVGAVAPVTAQSQTTAKTTDSAESDGTAKSAKMKRIAVCAVVAIGLMGLGYAITGQKMATQPGAPALDLSQMDTDTIATIDSNPNLINSIQQDMMAAMKTGMLKGGKSGEAMEAEHMAALKNMGLEPGPSMANAMACLGQ